jgi:hypothetical protein
MQPATPGMTVIRVSSGCTVDAAGASATSLRDVTRPPSLPGDPLFGLRVVPPGGGTLGGDARDCVAPGASPIFEEG